MEHKWWTLVTVCAGIFMLLLDITIVNIALPDIAKDLGASFSDLQWVIDAYALSLAALLLTAGSLGDLGGHRLVFSVGLVIFSLASLACGLAQDPALLIASRAVQGVGGAAMFATSLALIANEFHGPERGVALGAWGATAGAAVALGPLVGGALTSGVSWRWVFLVNVPIGAHRPAGDSGPRAGDCPQAGRRPDWGGFVTLGLALFGIIYGLIRGNPDGWTSATVLTGLVGGVILLVAFVVIELRSTHPDARAEAVPDARRGGRIGGRARDLGHPVLDVPVPDAVSAGHPRLLAPSRRGLRFLPVSVVRLLVAPFSGRASQRVPARVLVSTGLLLVAIGLAG